MQMKLKRIISSLLLAVYATSVLGYAATIIFCHCSRSDHFRERHHIASTCCHCCHHHSTAEGVRAEHSCDCHHDHTTEIDLYDKTRLADKLAKPLICYALAATITAHDTDRTGGSESSYFQLKIPLPQQPLSTSTALRAPPVKA